MTAEHPEQLWELHYLPYLNSKVWRDAYGPNFDAFTKEHAQSMVDKYNRLCPQYQWKIVPRKTLSP